MTETTTHSPVEAQRPVEKDWRSKLDPTVLALATKPDSITDPQTLQLGLREAARVSGGNLVIVKDEKGMPRWAEELDKPGRVLAFDSNIRAPFDDAPDDPKKLDEQGFTRFGKVDGDITHVMVETEDGQQLLIRRTVESNSANKQKFDIASTTHAGTDKERHPIDSSMLKHVVAVVGEPLVLGVDPQTGKRVRTRSPITKITTMDMRKDPVDPSHPRLQKQEFHRDTVEQFGEAMREARRQKMGEGITHQLVVPPAETSPASAESADPYERFSDEQLIAIRNNIADSIVDGIRRYDETEVERAAANLAAVQRQFEQRFASLRPEHAYGETDGAVTYATAADSAMVQRIVAALTPIDGARNIAAALYGGFKVPLPGQASWEERLQAMDVMNILSGVSKEIRRQNGSDIVDTINIYAAKTNEELARLVDRFKQTIADDTSAGRDTKDMRENLALIGQVIQARS